MTLASEVGRDRPDVGTRLMVLADGARLSSEVRWSGEVELRIAVARSRDGRRIRLALGAHLMVAWADSGEVRARRYCMTDVLGGGDPQWRLVPTGPAEAGDRRMSPRVNVEVPVAVEGSAGLVVGTSADLSLTGARVTFPYSAASTSGRPLPQPGETARVVVLLAD